MKLPAFFTDFVTQAKRNDKVMKGLSIGSTAYKKISMFKVGTPILVLACLSMITLPMPPFLLDMLFSLNIALSMIVLLVAIYSTKPLDFGSFPSVLLLTTILRLSLNVASTRVILLNGQNGTAAAGKVIESFGNVVMGGNYTVGIIVFAILIIINLVQNAQNGYSFNAWALLTLVGAVLIAIAVLIMFVYIVKDVLTKRKEMNKGTNYFALYTANKWGVINSYGETVISPSPNNS